MGKAEIDIVLQPQGNGYHVQAGSWMKGYILLNIERGSVRANGLDLSFQGHEQSEIVYDETEDIHIDNNNDGRRNATRTESSSRVLINVKLPVGVGPHNKESYNNGTTTTTFIDNAGNINPGQYQIPFEVEVPSYLPGSMQYQHSDKSRCSIHYELKAILSGSGFFWNYHKELPIQILAKPMDPLPPSPHMASPVNEPVTHCCCCNKGSISLGGKVEETRLAPESQCTVSLSCRNHSTVQPQNVRARIRQEVKWQCSGHSKTVSKYLVTVEFPSILNNLTVTQPHHHHQHHHGGRLADILLQDDMADMFREINDDIHQGTLIIPPNILDTYSGHLITVKHRLELEVKTGCCISDPSIYIPIWIGQAAPSTTSNHQTTNVNTEVNHPPMADGIIQAPAVIVSGEDIILPVIHVPSSSVYPIPSAPMEAEVSIPQPDTSAPSFDLLIREMKGTVSHLDLIERKIKDPNWNGIWQQMTSMQFGRIVGCVQMGFDQPRVAEAIAKELPVMSCEYIVAAVRWSMDYQRTAVVEKLVPLCQDLVDNKILIEKELTDWEKLVTEHAITQALANQ